MKKRSVAIILCSFIILNVLVFSIILNHNFLTGYVSFGELFFGPVFRIISVGQVFIDIVFHVDIISPQNITYNFNKSENYTIDLNVSSNRDIETWWYTLKALTYGLTVNESVIFVPNSTFIAARKSNQLIVYGNDSLGNVFNTSVIFYVNVSNSNPLIENISSEILVCEGSYLSYFFNVSDPDGDPLVVDISPKNPFYISFYRSVNYTLSSYEIFSGILTKSNAGGANAGSKNYSETITAADEVSSDSKNTNITVIEINNPPSISNIGVQTIWAKGENSTFDYQIKVSDEEDGDQDSGNFGFSINFSGDRLFEISSNGTMNFTANSSYLGVHNISICVNDAGLDNPHPNISLCGLDGSSLTSCSNFSLTITDQNRPPSIISYYPSNLSFNAVGTDSLFFNVSESDPDGTFPDVYWYVNGILEEYDSGNLTDNFYYSFGCEVSGDYNVTAVATDGELNDSIQWNISVSYTGCPKPSAIGGGAVGAGAVACIEKWGCGEWSQCRDLDEDFSLGKISSDYMLLIKERCSLFNWSDSFCGYQGRACEDINFCRTSFLKPGVIRECYYTKYPNCTDNIKNCHEGLCEVLVDCGGPCSPCPTCSDGIQNQNEQGIDCGGPCSPCEGEILSLRTLRLLVYLFLLIFLIALALLTRMFYKYYKLRKKTEGVLPRKIRRDNRHS